MKDLICTFKCLAAAKVLQNKLELNIQTISIKIRAQLRASVGVMNFFYYKPSVCK